MCGIIGEFRFDKKKIDKENFKAKLNSIKHRGPDGEGIWSNDNCILGHVRLSIIDLSENGAQPMKSAQNNIISYNGELYNHKDLKNRIDDTIVFKSSSDTEVLLNLLDADLNVLKDLRGMFAFAYFDSKNDELILVRDQLGIKPLYYHVNDNRIVFGSEIRTILLDPEYERSVNEKALKEHLILGYALNEETLFKGIHRLGAGHYLRISLDGIKKEKYFDIVDYVSKASNKKVDLDRCLKYSINIHAVSDVKLGMMLSGGFDSNLILNYLNATGNLNNEFIAFNAGLGLESESESTIDKTLYSERAIAEKIAHRYKVKLKKIEVSAEKFIKIKEFIDIIEEPICNPSGFLINEICGKAKDTSNKVLFSGHGGDEIFGGYRRHMAAKFIGSLKGLRWLANLIPKNLIKSNDLHRIVSSMKSKYQFFELSAIGIQSLDDGLINSDNIITKRDLDIMAKEFERPIKGSSLSTLKKMMALEFKGYLSAQNLINMDKFSMINSIEVRVPFLNLEIIKRGFKFIDDDLVKKKINKIPLRNLATKKLPKEIFKLKKSGFGPSLKSLLYSPESIELLTGDITKSRGIINTDNILKKINNNKISQAEIMQLINFAFIERWFRTYID